MMVIKHRHASQGYAMRYDAPLGLGDRILRVLSIVSAISSPASILEICEVVVNDPAILGYPRGEITSFC
jgi:hypothetical protein